MFWQLLCGLMLALGGALLTAHGEHGDVHAVRLGSMLVLVGGGVLGMLFQKFIGGFSGKKKKPE